MRLTPTSAAHVLTLPDFDRADRIGSYWGNPKTRTFAELLIDCDEDRVLRGGAGGDAARGGLSLPRPLAHREPASS